MMSVDTARSGTDAAGVGEPFEVARRRVAAVHGGQHAIAAGLQRVVQVLAHGRGLGHRRERLRPHVLGVRAGEPHPPDPVDGADDPQQIGEQRAHASGRVARVGGPRVAGRARSC